MLIFCHCDKYLREISVCGWMASLVLAYSEAEYFGEGCAGRRSLSHKLVQRQKDAFKGSPLFGDLLPTTRPHPLVAHWCEVTIV